MWLVGYLFIFPESLNLENMEFCPNGYKNTTNNQMELKACSEALKQSLKLDTLKSLKSSLKPKVKIEVEETNALKSLCIKVEENGFGETIKQEI